MKPLARAATLALFAVSLLLAGAHVTAGETQADKRDSDIVSCHLPIPLAVPEALFDQLIGWIALHTSHDVSLAYQTPATLSYCDVGEAIEYGNTNIIVEKPLRAAFDRAKRHIYLVQPWSPVRPIDQSVLLHEMIHDIQYYSKDWECTGAAEPEAYRLQAKWLLEHGIDPKFDWQSIVEQSRCP